MQPGIAVGQPARLTAWPVRIAFVAMIAGAAALRIGDAPQKGRGTLLAPVRAVLEEAGYRVDPVGSRSFLNGTIVVDRYLVARHAGCGAEIIVQPVPIADTPSPTSVAPTFVFSGWTGGRLARGRILIEQLRLQALSIVRLGRGVRPVPVLLVVSDPSACLAIATPDWRGVWIDRRAQ